MGRNFDDYPGFQPFRSWANTYAQDCSSEKSYLEPLQIRFGPIETQGTVKSRAVVCLD